MTTVSEQSTVGQPLESELRALEHRTYELVKLCETLQEENRRLNRERERLLRNQEEAHSRVEDVINKLRSLEASA